MLAFASRGARSGALLVSLLVVLAAPATPASADSAVLDNGSVQLGLRDFGNLTVDPPIITGFRAAPGQATGLRLLRGDQPALEGVSGGCCEGWGVADAGSRLTGYTNCGCGPFGLQLLSFTHDGDSAVSLTRTTGQTDQAPPAELRAKTQGAPLPVLQIRQEFGPAQASRHLFEDVVTITNTGTVAATDLRYRRVVDWDVEPTPGNELLTIDGTASPNLLYSSDGGTDSANPLGLRSAGQAPQCPVACAGFFTDAGPSDRGAHLDLGFGALAAGASITFTLYYGAAPSEAQALAALAAAGADVWSLAQSSEGDGGPLGVPATFILAFDRGAAAAPGPSPSLAVHAPVFSGITAGGAPQAFDVSAGLRNFGLAPATNVSVDLDLPAGLTLVSGSDPAALGSLAPGAEVETSWRVQPAEQCADTTYHVGAAATWDEGASQELAASRSVLVRGSCSRVYGYLTGRDRTGVRGLPGAAVDLCEPNGVTGCTTTTTDATGRYEFADLVLGSGEASHDYMLIAHGSGIFTSPPTQTSQTITTARASVTRRDFGWEIIEPIALGTTIDGPGVIGNGPVPTIYWNAPVTLHKAACSPPASPSSARYRVIGGNGVTDFIAWTPMTRLADGSFVVTIPALFPSHGNARIEIELTCGGDPPVVTGFDVYIDPSGLVRDQDGKPIPGATVILYRYEGLVLDYIPVSDGSAAMSPANRTNPDLTDAAGHFGWDVIAGNYKVRAQKSGCHAPGSATPYVESANLTIPPPVTDLDLRLECDKPATSSDPAVTTSNPGTTPVPGITPILGARGDTIAPLLTGLAVVPKRFKPVKPGRRAKAKIVFKLTEPASVRFTIARIVTGHRVGGRCVSGAKRGATRCTSYKFVRALTQPARTAGAQSVAFGGLSGTRKTLAPGDYRLTAVPTDDAGNTGARKTAAFTIRR
jgi:hypothetical protein